MVASGAETGAADLLTPRSLLPPWPALPFHAVLRSIGHETLGVAVVIGALLAPLTLAFRRWSTTPVTAWLSLLGLLPILAGLGWAGAQAPEVVALAVGRVLTGLYFVLLLIVFPLLGRTGRRP